MSIERHRFRHDRLLGTVVEIDVAGPSSWAGRLDAVVIAEIERLERVFSIFDPNSEFERWKRDEVPDPSSEFRDVMALALDWQVRSGGSFNTAVGVVSTRWRTAAGEQREPSRSELDELAASIVQPRYRVDHLGRPVAVGDCSVLDLNAIAKGWIVDRAVERVVSEFPDTSIVVNAGGDLLHRGPDPLRVGIENPLRPYDNEPPVAEILLMNAGLATSGRARRGVRVAGRWHSHVIDPRTAGTVELVASVSVVAHDAATADVVATIVGVLDPTDAVSLATTLGAGCLVIDDSGTHVANDRWYAITA